MKLINKITSNSIQHIFLTGNAGARIALTLRYLASQQVWEMDIQQGDFVANGMAVVGSPNMLRAYKNIIGFGIACKTLNGLDPYFINDFETGNALLYLLTAEEVATMEATLFR